MFNKKKILFILALLSMYISGCTQSNQEVYSGEALSIFVIGDPPTVSEGNVGFISAELSDLENDYTSLNTDGDALFIMPEELEEASNDMYSAQYNKLKIPIFFIGTTKGHGPFVFEGVTYQESQDTSTSDYAVGYLYDEENQLGETWEFNAGNEEELSENDVKGIYSDIFRRIDSLNQGN